VFGGAGGAAGTLNLAGGTVEATNIFGSGGASTINLNSGTLDLQPAWAASPGVIANLTTLNVGAGGATNPAVLTHARTITTVNAITIASNGVLRGNTIVTSPGLTVNGTIAPGASAGSLTNNGPATFGAGGRYSAEISDAIGGPGVGWDYLRVTGGLNVTATAGNPFTLQVQSLDGIAPGEAGNFSSDSSYDWEIASAGGGVTGFDAGKFAVDATFFANDLEGGYFYVQTNADASALVLSFTNNHTPLAATAAYFRNGDTVVIPIASLAANWSDADGDPVALLGVNGTSTNGVNVGTDGTNIYYTNAAATADAILYTVGDVRTNAPAVYRGGDTQRTATGTILILPLPSIQKIAIAGSDVILSGAGGPAGGTYYVLASTSVALPLSNWTAIATGLFDGGGAFQFTNAVDPAASQRFYRLQVP
jgi:hypothetical protein